MKPPQKGAQARGGREMGVSPDCLRPGVMLCWKAAIPWHLQLHEPISVLPYVIQFERVCHWKVTEPKLQSAARSRPGSRKKLQTLRQKPEPLSDLPPNSQHTYLGLTSKPSEPPCPRASLPWGSAKHPLPDAAAGASVCLSVFSRSM